MGLTEWGPDNALSHWSLSETFLQFTLIVAMLALGAASAFFLSEKEKVLPDYRGAMTASAIICAVAAVAYSLILRQYAPGRPFPTAIRYADWAVTTPLLLLKYPEMLRLRGFRLAWMLVVADLFMVVTGFIGELYGTSLGGHWYPHVAGGIGMHYVWGAVSTLGYVVILSLLLTEVARLAKTQPAPIRHGLRAMNLYIVSLWGVYPLAYVAAGLSASHLSWHVNLDWFNVASNIADVINKVGFGLTAFFALKALSGDDQESADRLGEGAEPGKPA